MKPILKHTKDENAPKELGNYYIRLKQIQHNSSALVTT